ncbi:choice-of-anchor D domain-containing protein [Hymenobacter metallilatus]|nr:choice-of-anchor D domain-containing protein [Hymenobacter metallilatus]
MRNFKLVAASPNPTLTPNPTTLTGFTYVVGSTTSASKNFALTGSNLTAGSAIVVTAPADYEVSTDNSTFGNTATLANTAGGTLASTTIYVRLKLGLAVGNYNGQTITISGGGTATAATVTVSGTVTAAPALIVAPGSLNEFTTPQGTASAAQTYTLTGTDLTSGVTVTAPSGYEVAQSATSTTTPGSFTGSLTVSQTNAATGRTLYVRLAAATAAGTYGTSAAPLTVSNAASGAVTQNVAVYGTVAQPTPAITATPSSLTGFGTQAGTPSAEQTYSLTPTALSAPVTVTAPAGYEVSLTSGTGFASSVQAPATGATTIYVRLTGATTGSFAGNITNVSGSVSQNVAVNGLVSLPPTAGQVLISQVYGGGGNSQAPYNADFIELHNTTSSDLVVGGYSVQYASASGSSWVSLTIPANTTIAAGGYYLIRASNTGSNGASLPTPDLTTNFSMSSTAAKIALVGNATPLNGSCPSANVLDLVGYGAAATCAEGQPTSDLSNTTAALRQNSGCLDTQDNSTDFSVTAPAPRNSASPANICTPQPEINLAQAGTNLPVGSTLAFGSTAQATTVSLTVDIQNKGNAVLNLTGTPVVSITGTHAADFTVTQPSASTVAANGSVSVTVSFTPSGGGTRTATLTIASNDLDENPYQLTLTGTVPTAYTWNGTGSSWDAAASWTPSRTTPTAQDVLVIDGSTATITTDFASGQSIAQLLIRNNANVTLTNTGARTLTISNGNTTGADLVVEAGSALTVTSPNSTGLTLQLGSGATGAIGGSVILENGAHRVLGSGVGSLQFVSGSSFLQTATFSGNAFGATSTYAGTVIFRSGSRLEQAGGLQPFGTSAPSSVISLEAGSTYVYSNPAASNNVPPLAGRTFGHLEFNVGSGVTTTSGANSSLIILGNLTVTSGTVGLNLDADITIGGNITVESGATVTFIPEEGGIETVTLNGTAQQTISGSGTLTFGPTSTLRVNNAAGIALARPLAVQRLQLSNGLVTTSSAAGLTLLSGATLTGGSSSSYIRGPLVRQIGTVTTATSFLFPIGKDGKYRPSTLTITTQTGTTSYTAELLNQSARTSALMAPLTRVSAFRYTTITPDAQPAGFSGTVTLSFETDDQVTDPAAATFVVAKRSSGSGPWESIGRTASSGSPTAGTLTSDVFTTFSDFALASTAAEYAVNPLPVTLVSFEAVAAYPAVRLAWATASEQNNLGFEVQRSSNGIDFQTIGRVQGHGTTSQGRQYTFLDTSVPGGTLYYRLRQLDSNGKYSYSSVRVLSQQQVVSLFPNPARTTVTLQLPLAQQASYQILNGLGSVVLQGVTHGTTQLPVAALPAGVYQVHVITAAGRSVQKFVKE